MGTELARVTDIGIDELGRTALMLAKSGFFGNGNQDMQVAQIGTKILAGREMGYGPFASVNGIHVIQGKPTIAANLMAAAVKGHARYDYRVRRMDNEVVEIEFFECGKSLGVESFTMDDAKAAQLTSKENWKKFPRNMLFARCMSNGVRFRCPDVFNGNAVYVPEELGEDDDSVSDAQYHIVDDTEDSHVESPVDPGTITVADAPDDTAASVAQPEPEPATKKLAQSKPPTFKNVQEALGWAVGVGAYTDETVGDAYAALKAELKPGSAGGMWAAWIEHVTPRMQQVAA